MDWGGARSDRWFFARLFHGPRSRRCRAPAMGHHRANHAGRNDLRLPWNALPAGRVARDQLPADEHSVARPAERPARHSRRPGRCRPYWCLRSRLALWLHAVIHPCAAAGGPRCVPRTDPPRRAGRAVFRRQQRGGKQSHAGGALATARTLPRRAERAALFFGGNNEVESHRMPAVLLDTSVIIDGRIHDIAKTGFVDMPLVILSSVLRELQMVADSADATRRRRGRRGLDVLTEMQKDPSIKLQVTEDDAPPGTEIDAHLVRTAKRRGWAIMTNDFNLNRIAS